MSSTSVDFPPVSLTLDGVTFDRYHYDEEADSLCFHTGPGALAVDFDETAEDHLLRFDPTGQLLSLTILNARWLLGRNGALHVTLRADGPTARLAREVVEPLLVETPLY